MKDEVSNFVAFRSIEGRSTSNINTSILAEGDNFIIHNSTFIHQHIILAEGDNFNLHNSHFILQHIILAEGDNFNLHNSYFILQKHFNLRLFNTTLMLDKAINALAHIGVIWKCIPNA